MRSARSTKLVVAWALVALVAAAHPRSGVVLCVADDGHVELERGCAPGCAEATAPSHAGERTARAPHGSCADTLVSRAVSRAPEPTRAQPAVISVPWSPASAAIPSAATPWRRLASHSRRDLLSTVVLLV